MKNAIAGALLLILVCAVLEVHARMNFGDFVMWSYA